jgi:hypothetical protein
MRTIDWKRMARSWWGRLLIGAFIGGIVVAFANIDNALIFVGGMIVGALIVFLLGEWK